MLPFKVALYLFRKFSQCVKQDDHRRDENEKEVEEPFFIVTGVKVRTPFPSDGVTQYIINQVKGGHQEKVDGISLFKQQGDTPGDQQRSQHQQVDDILSEQLVVDDFSRLIVDMIQKEGALNSQENQDDSRQDGQECGENAFKTGSLEADDLFHVRFFQ